MMQGQKNIKLWK